MPRGKTVVDIAQLIYDNLPRDLPLVAGVLLATGSGLNHYSCLVGATTYDVLRPSPDPVVLPGCVVVQQMSRNGQWVVVTDNFNAPLPPGISYSGIFLVDGGPGPDGRFGTADDDYGSNYGLTDGPGGPLLVTR